MKLLDVFAIINESQFLIERDVVNAKELKQWAANGSLNVNDPQARTWYASQLFKFLLNRYEEGARNAELGDFAGDPPEWVTQKINTGHGNDILFIEPKTDIVTDRYLVSDWLNAMSANAAENGPLNLRMTWEEAVEAQAEWHADIARQSRVTELTAEEMEGVVTIMEFSDGYRWVDLQTEVCLKNEGTVMGHCVGQGGYTAGVQAGTTKILSLRDANNNPHATIEGSSAHPIHITKDMLNSTQADLFVDNALEQSFVNMVVDQIKGKENKPVVRKYRDYVQEFLTKFQIENFSWMGIYDLENSGLFKLHEGGYVNTEEIGEHVAKMDDGSVWHRVDSEYVKLGTSYSSEKITAKWYLFDKTGRSLGNMIEDRQSFGGSSIKRMDFNDPKYKEHVKTAFNTKFDKGRSDIVPDSDLYRNWDSPLNRMGLGVRNQKVGEPQDVGVHKGTTDAGELYATQGSSSDTYWLMNGDKIRSQLFISKQAEQGYGVYFDPAYSIPTGSMTTFLTQFEDTFHTGKIKFNHIIIKDRTILVNEIEWEPNQFSKLLLEEDGVKFYSQTVGIEDKHTWYNATDKHNHLLFNMNIEDANFKVKMVNDVKVAGFYAIYLLEHLEDEEDVDIGDKGNYSSFAREFLDQTGWFQSDFNHKGMKSHNYWMVMDESYPIHFTETHTYLDADGTETEENVIDEDTTMRHYWTETGLYDSGMEEDYFAGEYDHVYAGHNIGYDDEHDGYGEDDGGMEHTRTDYYVTPLGDDSTVMHPISGGSMRISR